MNFVNQESKKIQSKSTHFLVDSESAITNGDSYLKFRATPASPLWEEEA